MFLKKGKDYMCFVVPAFLDVRMDSLVIVKGIPPVLNSYF